MGLQDMLKVNYGDFYKFTISGSIILMGISWFAIYWLQEHISDHPQLGDIIQVTMVIYLIFIGCCFAFIFWAVRRWKKNQEKIDSMMDKELILKDIEISSQNIKILKENEIKGVSFDSQIKAQQSRMMTLSGALIMDSKNMIGHTVVGTADLDNTKMATPVYTEDKEQINKGKKKK